MKGKAKEKEKVEEPNEGEGTVTPGEQIEKLRSLTLQRLIERLESPTMRSYDIANALKFLRDAKVSEPDKDKEDSRDDLPFVENAGEQGKAPERVGTCSPAGSWSPLAAAEDVNVPFRSRLPFPLKEDE